MLTSHAFIGNYPSMQVRQALPLRRPQRQRRVRLQQPEVVDLTPQRVGSLVATRTDLHQLQPRNQSKPKNSSKERERPRLSLVVWSQAQQRLLPPLLPNPQVAVLQRHRRQRLLQRSIYSTWEHGTPLLLLHRRLL